MVEDSTLPWYVKGLIYAALLVIAFVLVVDVLELLAAL